MPGKVIVEIAVDIRILLQVYQCLSQVVHRVHHKVVARHGKAYRPVACQFQRKVREKVHESLEYTDAFLCSFPLMSYQRDVLVVQTPLVIGVAHLVTAGNVAERKGEIVAAPQFIMYLLAIHTADVCVDKPGLEVGEQRMVAERNYHYLFHFRLHRSGRDGRCMDFLQRYAMRVPLDIRQCLAHAVRPAKVFHQFHKVAADGLTEIVPFIDAVIHFERRGTLVP